MNKENAVDLREFLYSEEDYKKSLEEDSKIEQVYCKSCDKTKPITEFRLRQAKEDGSERRPRNKCKECERNDNDDLTGLQKKYGHTKPSHCECCGEETEKLNLDHCHKSKKFRGWLCTSCNVGISRLGDTIEGVMRAFRYLMRSFLR